jgi:hypothetical protein
MHGRRTDPHVVWFQQRQQMKDPLGLLCSNTVQPLLLSLSSQLTLDFLDDRALGSPIDTIVADIQSVLEGEATGLHLNCSKGELVTQQSTLITDPTLLSFRGINIDDAELRGVPLFT